MVVLSYEGDAGHCLEGVMLSEVCSQFVHMAKCFIFFEQPDHAVGLKETAAGQV